MNRILTGLAAIACVMIHSDLASALTISQSFDGSSPGASCGWDAGGMSIVSADQAYSAPNSCRLAVTKGDTAFGTWGGIIELPQKVGRGSEIWVRVRTFMPSGFDYDSNAEGNHLKFIRIHTMSDSSQNLGYDDIYINPKGISPPFQFIYEGEQVWSLIQGTGDSAATLPIVLGKWETYEMYVSLDATPAAKGGGAVVRFWKNGILVADIRDRVTLSSTAAYVDRVHLFTYWNGGSPATQQMYVDDVVVTTATPASRDAAGNPYVGMGGSPTGSNHQTTPMAPVLSVQ